MGFIYVLYCAFDFDKSVKDNSGWLSILSIGALIVVISAIINKRYLEYDLSFKNNRMKLLRRVQIYLVIPLSNPVHKAELTFVTNEDGIVTVPSLHIGQWLAKVQNKKSFQDKSQCDETVDVATLSFSRN